jgi:uncharacterized protein (TIRG00374 family)
VRVRLGTLLRLVVAVGLTAWYIFWKSDPADIGRAFGRTSWSWVLGACALVIVDRALMGYRWIALLAGVDGPRPPNAVLWRIFFISSFVGTVLPQSVGADAVRTWSLTRDGTPIPQSLASVLVDRLLGVTSVLLCAMAGLTLVPGVLGERWVVWAFVSAAIGCLTALAVIFSPAVDDLARRLLGRFPARIASALGRLLDALRAYGAARGVLFWVLVVSVAVQGLRILQAWLLGLSLDVAVPLVSYVALVPIVLLLMLLPVTINGLGVSQAAFTWAFVPLGVPTADAIALSILFVGLGIVGNLPGGLLYVAGPATASGRARGRP